MKKTFFLFSFFVVQQFLISSCSNEQCGCDDNISKYSNSFNSSDSNNTSNLENTLNNSNAVNNSKDENLAENNTHIQNTNENKNNHTDNINNPSNNSINHSNNSNINNTDNNNNNNSNSSDYNNINSSDNSNMNNTDNNNSNNTQNSEYNIIENPSGINPADITINNKFYIDPILGNDNNDGSIVHPWKSIQYVINNKVETKKYSSLPFSEANGILVEKNEGALVKSGDALILRTGFHGKLIISESYNENFITIKPYENELALLSQITVNAASKWRLNKLNIDYSQELGVSNIMISIVNHNFFGEVKNILVDNCTIYSIADSSNWNISDWNNLTADAIKVSGNNIMILSNKIINVDFGISVLGNFVSVLNNIIENFAGDGLRALGSDCLFEKNIVKNSYDVNENHDDGLQSWEIDETIPSRIKIRGNIFINYEDENQPFKGPLQGIGCFDGFYEDWTIENNLVIVDHWHGITFAGGKNIKIINNTVVDRDITTELNPWIMVAEHKDGRPSTECIIRNNIVSHRITASNDTIADHNYEADYSEFDTIFLDPNNLDFHLKSGSPLIDEGSSEGSPNMDLDGNPRPNRNGVDIGAYEYQ